MKKGGVILLAIVQGLPVTLPVAMAVFGLVCTAQLLVGRFTMSLVLPIGLLLSGLAAYYAQRMVGRRPARASQIIDVLVVVGVLVWVLGNIPFTSQHLFTNRDPASYNMTALWLVHHQSVTVPQPAMPAVAGITAQSLGFTTSAADPDALQGQGMPLVPALLAIIGKLAGTQGVLWGNVLFGGVGLLAFYGLGRRLVRARWAALATLVMAMSLPMLFFSRDTYTEPLTMAYIFGGLALVWRAQQGTVRWQWFLAGLVLGASALARIDAYLAFAGLVLFLILYGLAATQAQRGARLRAAGALLTGLAVSGYVGWLSVSLLSVSYYASEKAQIMHELQAVVAVLILGAAAVLLQWRYNWLARLDRLTGRWRDRAVWVVSGAGFLVLLSRPAWYHGTQLQAGGVVAPTFAEQTLNWIWWYIGPLALLLGFAGAIWLVIRLLRGKQQQWWPLLLTAGVTAALYVVQPSITADQPWATRRFLPLVMPCLVLITMSVLSSLYRVRIIRYKSLIGNAEVAAAVLTTIVVLSPLFVSYPFMIRRLYVPQLSQMQTICAQTPKESLVIWAGAAHDFATQPTHVLCGNDSLGLTLQFSAARQFADLADKTAGHQVMVGFFESDAAALPLTGALADYQVSSITYNEIDHSYKRAPRNAIDITQTVYMGVLQTDGTIAAK